MNVFKPVSINGIGTIERVSEKSYNEGRLSGRQDIHRGEIFGEIVQTEFLFGKTIYVLKVEGHSGYIIINSNYWDKKI